MQTSRLLPKLPVATESAQTPQRYLRNQKKKLNPLLRLAATQVKKKMMPKKFDEKFRLILKDGAKKI